MNNRFIYGSKYLVAEIFEKTFIITSKENNHVDDVTYHDLTNDLQNLIDKINKNPPQFKKEVSEEDEIKFLQILNKLKKNNIDNLSEDELDELALLQLERSKKNQPKEKEVAQKEEVVVIGESKQEQKKGRDLGELVNILNIEKTVKPNHETFKSYKTKEGSYGITFKGQTLFIDDLSEEMINEIVSKDSPIPFGKIRQVPYMLTKEALDNDDVRAKIDGDVVQVTYKREEKTQYDTLKNVGGTPKV